MIDFGLIEDFDAQEFLAAFAAQRPAEQDLGIEELTPIVEAWLSNFADREAREDVVDAVSRLWVDAFQQQTRRSGYRAALREFRESIGESLTLTSEPTDPPNPAQVARIAAWLSVSAINSGFLAGFTSTGGSRVRWLTMGDGSVRETHRVVDGDTKTIGGTFDVGGYDLHYPGQPVGPPEIWINCRCLLSPAGKRSRTASAVDSGYVEHASASTVIESVEQKRSTTVAPEEVVEEPIVEEEVLPDDVDLEEEDLVDDLIEIPVHGVATVEGVPTGDGRMFSVGALTNRPLPLPLRYEFVGTHGGDTSMVAVVGRIDEMWLEGNEYRYRGTIFTTKQYANEAIEGIVDGSLTGVSVEVDNIVLDPENEATKQAAIEAVMESGEMPDPAVMNLDVFSEARVCGFTIVPIPAYLEGFIALGWDFEQELTDEDKAALAACGCDSAAEPLDLTGAYIYDLTDLTPEQLEEYNAFTDDELQRAWLLENFPDAVVAAAFAPGTKDGPGWITHPRATSRLRRYWTKGAGAAKIRWGEGGDFNRCRMQLAKYVQNPDWLAGLCANMHKEALGIWPAQHAPGGRHALQASGATPASLFTMLAAAAPRVAPADWFANPNLSGPTALEIDLETGRVYGHLATWGVCHIGIPGTCTTAPHSASDYAYFRTGIAYADDGSKHRVGHLTLGTGHASVRANASAAASHYDNTGSVVADVAAGEDQYGIWVSGTLRDGVDEATARTLAAASLSGDWRTIGGSLELVGALAVNVPGFPIPRNALAASALGQTSLVAAGVVEHEPVVLAAGVTAEDIAAITRNAIAEFRHQEKRELRLAAIRPVREAVRNERLARVRELTKED